MLARTVMFIIAGCCFVAGDATSKDLERIQGEWKPAKVIVNGERVAGDISMDRLTIKGKNFTLKTSAGTTMGILTIDAGKSPPHIDCEMPSTDKKAIKSVGIYELDGDVMKVCYSVAPNPRPTDFKAEENSARALVIYHRVK